MLRRVEGHGHDDIALICYEKPSDFCHRHLVAQWLRDNGFGCSEMGGIDMKPLIYIVEGSAIKNRKIRYYKRKGRIK